MAITVLQVCFGSPPIPPIPDTFVLCGRSRLAVLLLRPVFLAISSASDSGYCSCPSWNGEPSVQKEGPCLRNKVAKGQQKMSNVNLWTPHPRAREHTSCQTKRKIWNRWLVYYTSKHQVLFVLGLTWQTWYCHQITALQTCFLSKLIDYVPLISLSELTLWSVLFAECEGGFLILSDLV